MVPTAAVNLRRQSRQWYQPGPMLLPPNLATVSTWPQYGQYAPEGQRIASKCARAASRSVKIGFVKSTVAVMAYLLGLRLPYPVCSVKVIIPPARGRGTELRSQRPPDTQQKATPQYPPACGRAFRSSAMTRKRRSR